MSIVKISDSGGREVSVTNDNALKVDPSGTTQPVILTTGNNVIGQIKITDGTDVADILDLANSNPLAVAIVDANGDQITSFGGGTEYTEGDTDTSIKGKAVLMEVAGNALAPLQGTVSDGLLVNLGSNNDVAVTSSALPTGAATAANQATIIGHVDGIEALLTTIDADTSNISTKIDTIAGAVSGTEMQVDVLTMPTVTVQATNLDIRDLVFATDKVDISGSTLAANSGVDIGDVTINNAAGASAVNIQDGGNSITVDDGGGSITVDGTISISGAIDTELPAATALADNTANPTAPAVGAFGMVWDGANWDRTPGNQTDGVLVNLGSNNDVTVTGSVTVSATDLDIRNLTNTDVVTAELSAVDNAVLDAIAASVAAIDTDTSTIIGHVDGIEALLTTIDADTSNISTKIDTLAGAVSGTEMQVDVLTLPALPTGTNTIGSVKLTDGTDTALITASGELSVLATAQPGTDIGDVTINNASGASAVNIQDGGNSITVDNAGTFVVQENGAALTALQLIDDTVFTDDTSTHSTGATKGLGIMAVANPTDANIDANDIGMLAMTLARALKIDYTTIAGTAVDTNSGNKSAGTQRMVVATDQPQLTTPLNVTIQAGASGGDTVYHLVSAATTNATNIKSSAGKVTGWYIYNSNAAARKVAFHDTSGTPTAGSSVYFSLMIPPSSGANVSFPSGIKFASGIGITTVTELADSDSTAVASNDLIINIYYV